MKFPFLNQVPILKNVRSSFAFALVTVVIFGSYSCKHDCPEPTNTTTTLYVATLQPGSEGKDAILSGYLPDTQYPDYFGFQARAWTINSDLSIEKSVMQFDYSSIPAGATITKATLTLYADTTNNTGSIGHSSLSGPNDFVLKRITQSWSEATVTYNTEPITDNVSVIQGAASTSASQSYEFDFTTWVQDEIAHPTSYYGFLMQMNSSTPYRSIKFCSSDHIYAALHPKLVIEYKK